MNYSLQLRKQFTLALKTLGQDGAIMRLLMGNKPLDCILAVSDRTTRELLQQQYAPDQVSGLATRSPAI